jgi:hypothetical protein
MGKYDRYQSVVQKTSDEDVGEQEWLSKVKEAIEKAAVQPRYKDQQLFDQINSIMNNKSKYPSVQAAVDDMKERSGLTAYLNKKQSEEDNFSKKTASLKEDPKANVVILVFKSCPSVKQTIDNCIKDSKGTLPIPVILSRVQSIHNNDVHNSEDWDDENLLRYISKKNLEEKSNHGEQSDYNNLGFRNNMDNDGAIDQSNTDAFFCLNPATKL